jgi:hypothetical protein
MIEPASLLHIPLAYIDPGSGSLLIQVLIGTILAVPFFLRSQLGRLYRAVRRQPTASDGDPGNLSRDS